MSTYNGERFLRTQLDSILAQEDVAVQILVRDDGSSDQTLALLEEYCRQHPVSWYQDGKNMGPARSFMQLLYDAPHSDYYAFADQDDYWMPRKLITAVERLEAYEGALYFCQTQLADGNLQPLPTPQLHPLLTLGECLINEFIGGCTMVIDHKLRTDIDTYRPSYLKMHDVWIYSIAQALGAHIVFDPKPQMLYRQHERNVVGNGYGRMESLRRRWQRISHTEHSRSQRAQSLLAGYAPLMPADRRCLVQDLAEAPHSFARRMRVLFNKDFTCAPVVTRWLFRLAVMANNF